MSKSTVVDNLVFPLFGSITATGVGVIIFQGLGALVLGILGALGGWYANKFLIPKLNKLFKK